MHETSIPDGHLQAMVFMHSRGYLHWDLQPENILLDEEWRVKLCDFGVTKLMSESDRLATTGHEGQVGNCGVHAPGGDKGGAGRM